MQSTTSGSYPGEAYSTSLGQSHVSQNHSSQNIGKVEKWASIAIGGGLVVRSFAPSTKHRLISLAAGASLLYRGLSGHCELYHQLGIDTSDHHDPNGRPSHDHDKGVTSGRGIRIVSSVHINRDRRDLYDLWRNLENLSDVMRHLESVQTLDDRRSRWVAKAPLGQTVQWDAEIINDQEGELIAWQSLPGTAVANAGSVRFKDSSAGLGTELTVSIKYDPPGGAVVAKVAQWLGQGLQQEVNEDLRRFKQKMETGEVATASVRPDHRTENGTSSNPVSH